MDIVAAIPWLYINNELLVGSLSGHGFHAYWGGLLRAFHTFQKECIYVKSLNVFTVYASGSLKPWNN